MKEVAILLLITLVLNGCGSSSKTTVQTAAGATWQAEMLGGQGTASGFSFITQFTVGSDGALSITYFQFLNSNSTQCFPVSGGPQSGSRKSASRPSTVKVIQKIFRSIKQF